MAPFPISSSLILGISTLANPAAIHSLAEGAIANPSAALHLSLEKSNREATSTRIAVLRRLLTADNNNETESWDVIRQVKRGERRVVVHVNKADSIAGLIRLKRDVAPGMKVAILGGAESWLVSIFCPPRPLFSGDPAMADSSARRRPCKGRDWRDCLTLALVPVRLGIEAAHSWTSAEQSDLAGIPQGSGRGESSRLSVLLLLVGCVLMLGAQS